MPKHRQYPYLPPFALFICSQNLTRARREERDDGNGWRLATFHSYIQNWLDSRHRPARFLCARWWFGLPLSLPPPDEKSRHRGHATHGNMGSWSRRRGDHHHDIHEELMIGMVVRLPIREYAEHYAQRIPVSHLLPPVMCQSG